MFSLFRKLKNVFFPVTENSRIWTWTGPAVLDVYSYLSNFYFRSRKLGIWLGWLYLFFLILLYYYDPYHFIPDSVRSAVVYWFIVASYDSFSYALGLGLYLNNLLPCYFGHFVVINFYPLIFKTITIYISPYFGIPLGFPISYAYTFLLRTNYNRLKSKATWIPNDPDIPPTLYWYELCYRQGKDILLEEERKDAESPTAASWEEWYHKKTKYIYWVIFSISSWQLLWMLTRMSLMPFFLLFYLICFLGSIIGLLPVVLKSLRVLRFLVIEVVSSPISFVLGYLYPFFSPPVLTFTSTCNVLIEEFHLFGMECVREHDMYELWYYDVEGFRFYRDVINVFIFECFVRHNLRLLRFFLFENFLWLYSLPVFGLSYFVLFLLEFVSRYLAYLFLAVPAVIYKFYFSAFFYRLFLPFYKVFPFFCKAYYPLAEQVWYLFYKVKGFLFQFKKFRIFLYIRFLSSIFSLPSLGSLYSRIRDFPAFIQSSAYYLRIHMPIWVEEQGLYHTDYLPYIYWYFQSCFLPIFLIFLSSPIGHSMAIWYRANYYHNYSELALITIVVFVFLASSEAFRDWTYWDLKDWSFLFLGYCLTIEGTLYLPITWIHLAFPKFCVGAFYFFCDCILSLSIFLQLKLFPIVDFVSHTFAQPMFSFYFSFVSVFLEQFTPTLYLFCYFFAKFFFIPVKTFILYTISYVVVPAYYFLDDKFVVGYPWFHYFLFSLFLPIFYFFWNQFIAILVFMDWLGHMILVEYFASPIYHFLVLLWGYYRPYAFQFSVLFIDLFLT